MAVQSPGAAPADTANTETSFEAGLALLDDMDAEEGADDQQADPVNDGAADPDDNVEDILAEDGVEEEEETDEAKAAKAAEGDVEELKPEATIKLSNGTVVKAADLEAAYNGAAETKAETTRILQETASERSNLQILGQNMSRALENISNYLVDQLPPEPDPQLAYTDAAEHYRQTMQRQVAIAELRDVLSVADGSKQAVAMLSDAEFQAVKREEDTKWMAAMPSLRKTEFPVMEAKAKAYAKSLGFSEQEVETTADFRLRSTFWKAARFDEIMAKAKQARGKVENASVKMPPAKARTHQNSRQALDQVNAKKRLAKSGTLNDAMKLNFE